MTTKYKIAAILCGLTAIGLQACSSGDVPSAPGLTAGQAGLDTRTREESDTSWEIGLTASDISWRFISFATLQRTISLVGSFKITFINTNFNQLFATIEALAQALTQALQPYWDHTPRLAQLTGFSWWCEGTKNIRTSQ